MAFVPPSDLPIHLDVHVDRASSRSPRRSLRARCCSSPSCPALQATTSDLGAGAARRRLDGPCLWPQPPAPRPGRRAGGVVHHAPGRRRICAFAASRWRERSTPGFAADGIVVGWIDLFAASYSSEAGRAFYPRLLDRVRAMPGVEIGDAGPAHSFGLRRRQLLELTVEGYQAPADDRGVVVVQSRRPGLLQTLRIPLVRGRDLSRDDVSGRPRVAIINETMARMFWTGRDPNQRPLRRSRARRRSEDKFITVVGVARDIKHRIDDRSGAAVHLPPRAAGLSAGVVLHVRTAGDPHGCLGELPRVVREIDRERAVLQRRDCCRRTPARPRSQQRLAANLLVVFGGLALLLAAIGSYGVLSYLVGQRRREIGIRLAIGATRASVFRLIVTSGAKLVGHGRCCGLPDGGRPRLRRCSSLLIGVQPTDPVTYAVSLRYSVTVAIAACALPARRAASLEPRSRRCEKSSVPGCSRFRVSRVRGSECRGAGRRRGGVPRNAEPGTVDTATRNRVTPALRNFGTSEPRNFGTSAACARTRPQRPACSAS